MNKYSEVFPNKNSLIVVIHSENIEQSIRNSKIAFDNGADGIFLINHDTGPQTLMDIYGAVREFYPYKWIGVNLLGISLLSIFGYVTESVSGVWTDNSQVYTNMENNQLATSFQTQRSEHKWLYFGGTAFKYQHTFGHDPATSAKAALPFMDVITTSGIATGSPPTIKKITAMRNAINDHPLAIASGIDSKNVEAYKEFVNCFLVASSISISHTELDPKKVKELANIIHK